MFIGHFGLGLGVKKAAPSISLGFIFMAVQFLDLLWPTFLLLDVEHVEINAEVGAPVPLVFTDYPYSHSLLMALVWSLALALVYWLIKKNGRGALIIAACVLSHWVLDLFVHVPDLPLYPGGAERFGLGMWKFPVLTFIVESFLFIGGLILYLKATRPKNKKGAIIFWILIGLLVVSHLANAFSPPPNSVTAIAWGAQLMWLLVILAFWADRNRTDRAFPKT
jgi:FtsH-binding integral membrane protein